jgi:chromosome segregation ATPase
MITYPSCVFIPIRQEFMKVFWPAIVAVILMAAPSAVKADYDSREDLERSRDGLLKHEDDLKRSYDDTCREISDLQRRLDDAFKRKSYLESELGRIGDSIKDVEYNLRR